MNFDETYQKALTYLSQRDHSEYELANKLLRKGATPEIIKPVIKLVQEEGFQDDQRFAFAYTVYRARRGFGPLRIQLELHARGVDNDIIIDALTANEFDWSALAKTAWRKKFKDTVSTSAPARAKQWRFLQYRGFLPEDCAFLRG